MRKITIGRNRLDLTNLQSYCIIFETSKKFVCFGDVLQRCDSRVLFNFSCSPTNPWVGKYLSPVAGLIPPFAAASCIRLLYQER